MGGDGKPCYYCTDSFKPNQLGYFCPEDAEEGKYCAACTCPGENDEECHNPRRPWVKSVEEDKGISVGWIHPAYCRSVNFKCVPDGADEEDELVACEVSFCETFGEGFCPSKHPLGALITDPGHEEDGIECEVCVKAGDKRCYPPGTPARQCEFPCGVKICYPCIKNGSYEKWRGTGQRR